MCPAKRGWQLEQSFQPGEAEHCRTNVVHILQSRPDSGLGLQVKVLKIVLVVPSSLGSGTDRPEPSDRRMLSIAISIYLCIYLCIYIYIYIYLSIYLFIYLYGN